MRMVPYRVGVWQTHRPLLVLVGVMAVIFFLQWALGREFYSPFMVVPAEVVEVGTQLREGGISLRGGLELGTLLTYAFLHGNAEHILFNMIFLWMFAALAVELLGTRWMFLIFLVTAFFGAVCHVALNRDELTPMLGASGAVMGFEGAYLAMALRWRLPDPHVWPISRPIAPANLALFAVVGVTLDYFGLMDHTPDAIAYGAHIGGFLSGVFLTGFLAPRPKNAHPR